MSEPKRYTYERLGVPDRPGKPRKTGLTVMIDIGPSDWGWTGPRGLKDLLEAAGEFIDFAKIFATNAIFLPKDFIEETVRVYKDYGVESFAGGILFESAYHQNAIDELITHLKRVGIEALEISENYLELTDEQRLKEIDRFQKAGFKVVYEFGRKAPTEPITLDLMGHVVTQMMDAGADHVIVEQSELDMLAEETPQVVDSLPKQSWYPHIVLEPDPFSFPNQHIDMIKRFGTDVSFCNVAPSQVLRLEGFRRGIGRAVGYNFLADALKG